MFALGDALFADAIGQTHRHLARPVLVGLCGPQGSGKSTTARRLEERLDGAGLRTVVLALDDFYLTRAERSRLAEEVHPLFAVRGVPGTHDIALLEQTLAALREARPGSVTRLPVFDKLADDRCTADQMRAFRGAPDVVLLEGWCIGATPQDPPALVGPVNWLEAEEDPDARWRIHANERLGADYAALFARLDLRLMLRAPGFDCVHAWRAEQEAGLSARAGGGPAMNDAALARFIAHYERLTRWLMIDEPADLIADLDNARSPRGWRRSAQPCAERSILNTGTFA
ncbi:AAA family ATPase [Sphingomonas qomolangmaensis]|uniref:Kinase n=1 Tax=Sphingomonas qomolangmaensis TaxID=2918765 RepID=A0ABY5L6B8_9SPHN|nr:AAA family ATPase [Sphingomonas qomolangmaensis]UUL82509.1 kinase [Sphingomonas qomolangmaensis]